MTTDAMSAPVVLAAEEIKPGEHWTGEFFGLTFNLDTIIATYERGGYVGTTTVDQVPA